MSKAQVAKIKTNIEQIKANVEQLTDTYDKLFAICLRQIKTATCNTKQEVLQRLVERKQLIEALESYLAAKPTEGESHDTQVRADD
jgi:ElaB/YqjD/DUF883 family membrane-anchored ribosome-binding protein